MVHRDLLVGHIRSATPGPFHALPASEQHMRRCSFSFQGSLPPPYSSAVPSAANGSLSSPVSTMTSHSSSSSLAKQRQSWLDLVSQASPAAATETAVVCLAQIHSQRPPEAEEADGELLASSSQPDSLETEYNEENGGAEEEEARTASSEAPEGEA